MIQMDTFKICKSNSNLQNFMDICMYISNNRDSDYDKVIDYIKQHYTYTINGLNSLFDRYSEDYNSVTNAMRIILKRLENKKSNITDLELEKQYNKIGKIQIESGYDYYGAMLKKKNKTPIDLKLDVRDAQRERNIEICTDVAYMLIGGASREEVAEKFGIKESHIDTLILKYLPKFPEAFVDYKIFIHGAKRIDSDELEQFKEVINYFVTNLNENINGVEASIDTYDDKRDGYREIAIMNKQLRIHLNCLKCLNLEKVVTGEDLKIVDEFIKDYCLQINEVIKLEKRLKTNYVKDSGQEEIYNIYRKKLNI